MVWLDRPGFAALNYFRWQWVVAWGVALGGRGRAQAALRRLGVFLNGYGWLWVAVGGCGWLWLAAWLAGCFQFSVFSEGELAAAIGGTKGGLFYYLGLT